MQLAVPGGQNQLAGAADAVNEFASALGKARDQSQLVDARLKSSAELDDQYLQFQRDDDPATAPARFTKAAQDISQKYYDGLTSQDAKDSFALDYGQMMESRRVSLTDVSFRRESDTALANVEAAGDSFARQAAYATNPAERAAAITAYSKSVMGVADAGMMDHATAQKKVEKFEENLALYDGRALIEKNPTLASKQLADPNFLPRLDPLQRIELTSAADAKVRQAEREARADYAAARSEARMNAAMSISDLDASVGSGLPVSQAVVDQATRDVRASGDPRLANHLGNSLRGAYFASSLRGATPGEVEGKLAAASAQANQHGADASLAAEFTGGRKFLETMNHALAQDPLSWAAQQGVATIQPLQLNGQDNPQAWQGRIRAAAATAQHYGIQPHYLTAAEGDQIKQQLAPEADPRSKMSVLQNLTAGLGSRAVPELARLGVPQALITAGGLLTAGPAHARTAFDIVNGQTALTASTKGGDGQSVLRPRDTARSLSTAGAGRLFGGVTLPQGMPQVLQATAAIPGEAARISNAADAIYAARAPAQGLSGKDAATTGLELFQRAIQEAAGARFEGETQMGGMTQYRGRSVIAPATVAADAFEGVVSHLTAKDLADASVSGAPPVDAQGKAVASNLIRHTFLVTAGDGRYALSTTDPAAGAITPVKDAKGGIYRLDFQHALTLLQSRAAGGQK
jgi:hypothetical protein